MELLHSRLSRPAIDFAVEVLGDGRSVTIAVSGELDMATAPELATALETVVGIDEVELDLVALSFVSAAGVTVLLRGIQLLHGAGARLRIVPPRGGPARVLKIAGVSTEDLVAGRIDIRASASPRA
jgi:anti-sigma B factor antagonist